jgi:uncharacterized membrane protein
VLQAVDLKGLVGLARQQDVTVRLHYAVGDYVPEDATLLSLLGRPAAAKTAKRAQGLFALGQERTIEQDPAFALRVIVDIAIRALSPAVNDPTTAVQLLDHVEALLQVAGESELRAMYQHLLGVVRPEHRAVVEAEMARLDADLRTLLPDPGRRAYAATPDRQAIGGVTTTDRSAPVAQAVGSSGSGDAS